MVNDAIVSKWLDTELGSRPLLQWNEKWPTQVNIQVYNSCTLPAMPFGDNNMELTKQAHRKLAQCDTSGRTEKFAEHHIDRTT